MSPGRAVALVGGVLLLGANFWELLRALVVPRPHARGLVGLSSKTLRRAAKTIRRVNQFERRDKMLAVLEPLLMLWRLAMWLALALLGWALVGWAVGTVSFGRAVVESGSSVFTLGFATENRAGSSVVEFLAASSGQVIVALQIAYLPALYEAFNRREMWVTMLESHAASPAWGPELLARHHLVGLENQLDQLYLDWEQWSASVAESHTTYASLLEFRSPHPTNSWIVSLIAVLDAATLQLALNPATAPYSARMCVRMGFTCLRDIARSVGIPFDPDPMPDTPITLSRQEFLDGIARLERAGVTMERSPDEAWVDFNGWRINYESIAYALADILMAPPAPWTGERSDRRPIILPTRPVDRRPGAPEGYTPPTKPAKPPTM